MSDGMIRYRLVFAFLCVLVIAGGMGWQAQSSRAAETVRLSLSTTPERELVFHNLKPGDQLSVDLVIKNTSGRKVDYSIQSRFDHGDESFYKLLEVTLENPGQLLYQGKLSGMTGQLGTGSLAAEAEDKLVVTAYFPVEAGNEYQDKAVVTVLEFAAKAAPDDPGPEPSATPSSAPTPTPDSTSGATPTPGPTDEPGNTPAASVTTGPPVSPGASPAASQGAAPSAPGGPTPLSPGGSGATAAPGTTPALTISPLPSASGLALVGGNEEVIIEDEPVPAAGNSGLTELPAASSQDGARQTSAKPYTLPDTATPWFNLLVICTLSILCCAVVLWRRRKE
jgi:hypothetical protein